MESPFSPPFEFEMFDDIGQIDLASFDARLMKRRIEKFPSGTNEWFAFDVFAVPRLFSHQHQSGIFRTYPKDSLGCIVA